MRWTGASVFVALAAVFFAACWCGVDLHQRAHERARVQTDYSEVNGIEHGLLSVDVWMSHLRRIVTHQIDRFSLSKQQRHIVKAELERALDSLLDRIEQLHPETFKGKVAKAAVGMMSLREHVPALADGVVEDLGKPESRRQLKQLAIDKLDEYAAETRGNPDEHAALAAIFARYHVDRRDAFNRAAVSRATALERRVRRDAAALVVSLLVVLGAWLAVLRRPSLRRLQKPVFAISVLVALVSLLAALSSPMLEIDARIQRVDFVLLGEHLRFDDQVLFYQSKSIFGVVHALFGTHHADSMFVGALILAFSILVPIAKLIATEVLLIGGRRFERHRLLHFAAFKMGKWSMADVLVVATFMAYVGFRSILDSELSDLDVSTASLSSITTNGTSLLPAFAVFVAFVLFGLVLSELLRRSIPRA